MPRQELPTSLLWSLIASRSLSVAICLGALCLEIYISAAHNSTNLFVYVAFFLILFGDVRSVIHLVSQERNLPLCLLIVWGLIGIGFLVVAAVTTLLWGFGNTSEDSDRWRREHGDEISLMVGLRAVIGTEIGI
ncbi:hypothetical protein BDY21DRAFT_332675 [Lineolata rhizophorae]|uniref:Uncharacterized protein n=1 Tax=Lineolata rhizophorae TaxID=578093 RepID=A0A6A6PCC3_9PEZI|nr:hypothetical protein BDY21DRAFT_332675 [Lineolata rhizophorae]